MVEVQRENDAVIRSFANEQDGLGNELAELCGAFQEQFSMRKRWTGEQERHYGLPRQAAASFLRRYG